MDHDAGPSSPKREKFEDDPLDGDEVEEPQERLQMTPGDDGGIVWLARVPKSLMEVWKQVQVPNTHLATIRVYDPTPDGQRKISLLLPEEPTYQIGMESRELEVVMQNERVDSQYIVADKEKPNQPNRRLRSTKLTGKVHHKVLLRNKMSPGFEAKIRLRSAEANRPKKQISKLYSSKADADMGATNLKMIQSGAAQSTAGFGNLGKKNKTAAKGEFERAARISRDELLDLLFSLFTPEKQFWSMKELRVKTVQPEAYLKEVLTDIGVFHKAGSNVNHWSLKPEYVSGNAAAGMMMLDGEGAGPSGVKQEGAGEEDDDDDDDDDMEEVS